MRMTILVAAIFLSGAAFALPPECVGQGNGTYTNACVSALMDENFDLGFEQGFGAACSEAGGEMQGSNADGFSCVVRLGAGFGDGQAADPFSSGFGTSETFSVETQDFNAPIILQTPSDSLGGVASQ